MKHLVALILFFSIHCSFGQSTDSTAADPYEMSLEQLMNIKVSASKTNLSSRETPSIVSVITREDIKNMGARDLMDILNQVPGMSFASDVQNVVGIGSRGNWGHEGKILLLIDGNEMNEILYATTQFGQHYNISNIDRIEIIRGPGSSIYGGYAELGVINIITRNGQQMKEASLGIMYGNTDGIDSRKNVRLNIGSGNEKVNYSFSGIFGKGLRSTGTYTDFAGTSTDMSKTSILRPMMFNGGLNVGELSVNMIYDGYATNTADQFDAVVNVPLDVIYYNNFYTSVKYNIKPSDKITITPRVNFKSGSPWKTIDNSPFPYNVSATRIAPSINAAINPSEQVNLVLGLDSYFDNATAKDDGHFSSLNKDKTVSFYDIGVFAQGVFKTTFANFTLGARFDNHNQFGSAFSPRIGITKAWPNFHMKALYSRAFRAPAIENINLEPTIKPEKTGVAELELGYKINDNMFLTANGFHILISDPIVYYYDNVSSSQKYGNFGQAGSMGFEIDYRLKYNWGYVSTNYAYYTSKDINKAPLYSAVISDKAVLGLPGGRLNLLANFKISDMFSINPSVNMLSKRYAVTGQDVSSNFIYSEISSQFIGNLFLRAKGRTFDAGVGVYNITDEKQVYIQAYSGGHAPLPGLGREFVVNLQYIIPFK